MNFKAYADQQWDGVALYIVTSVSDDGSRRIVEPVQWPVKEYQRGDFIEPTMRLSAMEAQNLMDALWSTGLRPAEANYPSEHVNALRDHLADMRRLVFKDTPT